MAYGQARLDCFFSKQFLLCGRYIRPFHGGQSGGTAAYGNYRQYFSGMGHPVWLPAAQSDFDHPAIDGRARGYKRGDAAAVYEKELTLCNGALLIVTLDGLLPTPIVNQLITFVSIDTGL